MPSLGSLLRRIIEGEGTRGVTGEHQAPADSRVCRREYC